MSVEPQALERSVLERKERDELAAIAEAMGVKTGSRTSKANLIGQILREAGIETGEEKPKRSSKAKADNGATVDEEPAGDAAAADATGDDNGSAAATDVAETSTASTTTGTTTETTPATAHEDTDKAESPDGPGRDADG